MRQRGVVLHIGLLFSDSDLALECERFGRSIVAQQPLRVCLAVREERKNEKKEKIITMGFHRQEVKKEVSLWV